MIVQKLKSIEANVLLLAGLLIFWVVGLFISEAFFAADGQFFQVISGLVTAFSAALLALLNPKLPPKQDAPQPPPDQPGPPSPPLAP